MSTTSKSPRAVLEAAHAAAERALPPYSHRFSPHKFTQHQLFACLVLKGFLKTDYRGVAALLADCPDLRSAIGMTRTPHFTTLQKAAERLLAVPVARKLVDATVERVLKGRRVAVAAADSTGLESRHVSPYFLRRCRQAGDGKRTRRYTRFPKLDLIADCRTHVILAVSAGRGPRTDVDTLKRLLRQATRRARIDRLVADAGYDSEENHRAAREDYGITTTIPASRGRPSDAMPTGKYRGLMARRFNRRRYRSRAQVEAVMSMIKRRQGPAVSGRGYRSRCRDLWLMALTHNIMILWRQIAPFLQSQPNPVEFDPDRVRRSPLYSPDGEGH